jgi:hypothetical protein
LNHQNLLSIRTVTPPLLNNSSSAARINPKRFVRIGELPDILSLALFLSHLNHAKDERRLDAENEIIIVFLNQLEGNFFDFTSDTSAQAQTRLVYTDAVGVLIGALIQYEFDLIITSICVQHDLSTTMFRRLCTDCHRSSL